MMHGECALRGWNGGGTFAFRHKVITKGMLALSLNYA